MSQGDVDMAMLSAYVDGELSPADAARVARAIADNRSLAMRVAVLARLKSVVAETPKAPALQLEATPRRSSLMRLATATAAIVLATVALVAWQQGAGSEDALQAKLEDADTAHQTWIQARRQAPSIHEAAEVARDLVRVGSDSSGVPDLSGAGLHFAWLQPLHGAALHIGYRGKRGCMVSLVVHANGSAFPSTLETRLEGRRRVYLWRTGSSGYLMMASGMAPARLEVVARTVFEAVRDQVPLNEEAISLLIASRHHLPPCTA